MLRVDGATSTARTPEELRGASPLWRAGTPGGGEKSGEDSGDVSGAPKTSPGRDASGRRVDAFHSPQESSPRTVGHTPSIMYDF